MKPVVVAAVLAVGAAAFLVRQADAEPKALTLPRRAVLQLAQPFSDALRAEPLQIQAAGAAANEVPEPRSTE